MKEKKPKPVNLKKFDEDYIKDVVDDFMVEFDGRSKLIERYEKLYQMKLWKSPPKEGEYRMVLPLAFEMVESFNSLLLAREPVLSVPPATETADGREDAQSLERYLYGMRSALNDYRTERWASKDALMRGRGWIKQVVDLEAVDGDPNLVVTNPDPATVYYTWNTQRTAFKTLAHVWDRERNEIQDEWDCDLAKLFKFSGSSDALEDWLEQDAKFVEYWELLQIWSDKETEEDDATGEESDVPSVILMASQRLAGVNLSPQPAPTGEGAEGAEPTLGQTMAGLPEALAFEAGEEKTEKAQRVKVHRVVHVVAVMDGDVVKVIKKEALPKYKRIPYYSWAGREANFSGWRDSQSILYAAAGGEAGTEDYGVFQAFNLAASTQFDEVIKGAHSPLVTDDDTAEITMADDELIRLQVGRTLTYLRKAEPDTGVGEVMNLASRMLDRVSTPEVWNGQAFSLSGQAISGLANKIQMTLAMLQHDIEIALTACYEDRLWLTKGYADMDDGWSVDGYNGKGTYVAQTVTPDEITSCRVQVKLSASMPKDDIGWISLLERLTGEKLISRETFLDQYQKVSTMASDTPQDEMRKIIGEQVMLAGIDPVSQAFGQEMAQVMQASAPQPSPQPSPAGEGARPSPGGRGGQPRPSMAGMPVNPQTVAANGNAAGAAAMVAGGPPQA